MRMVVGLLLGLMVGAWSPAFAENSFESDSSERCLRLAALSRATEAVALPRPIALVERDEDEDLGIRLRLVAMIARLQDELDQFPAYSGWWYRQFGLTPIRFPLR